MSEKTVNPYLRFALEYGPIILFFVFYVRLKDDSFTFAGQEYTGFIAVTALFIPLMALSTFLIWRLTGRLSMMQIFTLVLVVIFGGLGIWFNDESFFKMKPTILYLFFATFLGLGILQGKSYLASLLNQQIVLTHTGWMILTRRLALFFAGLAVANEAIWRSTSTENWVMFKTFGLPIAIFAFFFAQSNVFVQHTSGDEDEDADENAEQAKQESPEEAAQ